MALVRPIYILLFVSMAAAVAYDDIDMAVSSSVLLKALKEMTNKNNTDTLNLPANASSIRENITDTFSCENRTYGYYADVDNDCQVFHVCLPSQTPSGRNITYRWSFICPNETIFNQEVLTCTRPRDSIDCEDSPMFYYVNMEFGKVPNKTEEADKPDKPDKSDKSDKPDNKESKKTHKRKDIRKQNIELADVINDEIDDDIREKIQEFHSRYVDVNSPLLYEAVIENTPDDQEDLDRIIMERNMRNAREMRRGTFRFKGDI